MKKIYNLLVLLLFIQIQYSCQEADELIPTTGNEVTSVTLINTDGEKYTAKIGENYDFNNPIVVDITGPRSLDFSSMSMYVGIPNNASVEPALGMLQDFTKPVTFTVIGADGERQDYTVKINHIVTFTIQSLWKKKGFELDFVQHENGAVAISGNNLIVHARKEGFNYFDIFTGEKKGTMSWDGIDLSPFPLHLTNDDGGHLISCNFTFGAGNELRMYTWDKVDSNPQLLFKWLSDAPGQVGRKLYVKGDIKKDAYIYAGVSQNNMFLRWEIKNGQLTSETPDKITFEHPNGGWGTQPKVVPVDASKNSNYFINTNGLLHITYMNGETNQPIYNSPPMQWLGHSHGFDFMDLQGEKFIFMTEVNAWNWMAEIFKVNAVMENPSTIDDISKLYYRRVWGSWTPVDAIYGSNGNATGETKVKTFNDGEFVLGAFLGTNGGVEVWRME